MSIWLRLGFLEAKPEAGILVQVSYWGSTPRRESDARMGDKPSKEVVSGGDSLAGTGVRQVRCSLGSTALIQGRVGELRRGHVDGEEGMAVEMLPTVNQKRPLPGIP